MNAYLKKDKAIIILIISSYLLFNFIILQPKFGRIDDTIMMRISAGYYGNFEPSEKLVFIHPLIGLLLKYLNENVDNVNWYGILMILFILLSNGVIATCIRKLKLSLVIKYSIIFLFLFTWGTFILQRIEFTRVAFNLVISGFTYLFIIYYKSPKMLSSLLVIFLIISGLMVRKAVFLPILLMSLPTIIFKKSKLIYLLMGVIFIISIGLNMINNYVYKARNWQEYFEFREDIVEFTDYCIINNGSYKQSFFSYGYSENDYHMLKSWFFADKEVFDKEKINSFINEIKDGIPFYIDRVSLKIHRHPEYGIVSILMILVPLIFIYKFRKNKKVLTILSTIFIYLLLILYLRYFKNLGGHVFKSMNVYLTMLILVGSNLNKILARYRLSAVVIIIILLTCINISWKRYIFSNKIKVEVEKRSSWLKEQMGNNKDTVFIDWTNNYLIYSPFKYDKFYFDKKGIIMSWNNQSPHQDTMIRNCNYESISDLILSGESILISQNQRGFDEFSEYFLVHYNHRIKWNVISQYNGLTFIRITK